MGRNASNAPFSRIASPDSVAAYDPDVGDCCSADDFLVDIVGYPRSEWNKSCARVFAESFLAKYEEYCRPLAGVEEVEETWITHFKTLRRIYAKQRSTDAKNQEANQRKRRGERNSQVSNNDACSHSSFISNGY
jgi:hypothetical protein